MVIGAALAGVFTTFLVQWFHSRGVQQDASIGIVFTTLVCIGSDPYCDKSWECTS